MEDNSHPTHLSPSELGTKDYWETYYARTLSHLSSKSQTGSGSGSNPTPHDNDDSSDEDVDDDDDPGTSWFSEHNAPEKVLGFLTSEEFPLAPCNTEEQEAAQPSVLDLGTGNGSMLALLRKRGGFRGVMVGVDYSVRSVELARELQRLKIHSAYLSESDDEDDDSEGGFEDEEKEEEDVVVASEEKTAEAIPVPAAEDQDTNIRFEEWDILTSEGVAVPGSLDWFPYEKGGFDIVLDKGTFDAVSLSEEVAEVKEGESSTSTSASGKVVQQRVCERYPGLARKLVRPGGFLMVTSCNWTEEELIRWFTGPTARDAAGSGRLEVWGRVEYPRFRFGGKEGQGVCTVCFQRVN